MSEAIFNSLDDFLNTVNIKKVDIFHKTENDDIDITVDSVRDHLKLISEFHKKTMGFNGYLDKRLENYTGKKVEEFKVYIKRLKRDIKRLESDGVSTQFEELVLKCGPSNLQRAETCISRIHEWGYYDLIDRSMKRIEICIGNSYKDNLRRKEAVIEIIDTKHAGYNMVESDCITYLSKLKKKGADLDWKKLIGEFCSYEGLGASSEAYIVAMLSYPHEFMRSINKYRYRKKDWTEAEYIKNLTDAMARDGKGLLD